MKTNSSKLSSHDYLIVLSMLYASVSLSMNIFCMKPLSWGTNVVFSDGGQTISLTVYYNNRVAYFYLQEYKGFSYEECCEPVCYERAEADKFSLRLK